MPSRRLTVALALVVFTLWVGNRVHAQFLTLVQPTAVVGPDVGFRIAAEDVIRCYGQNENNLAVARTI